MVLQKGQVLQDRWKVVDRIGSGGMSTVYLVKDLRLEKYWALKEVEIKSTPKGKILYQSVVAETNLLKSLNYASIPSIIEIMRLNSSLLIIMDYIDGKSLREVLADTSKNDGATPNYIKEKYIIRWGISLCKTLRYLHNHEPKIIYRDMKPQNVMLNNQNEIKLLDFGTAVAITEDFSYEKADKLGTKGFAAPEQYRSKNGAWFDERSDIYALGKTLYYLATGWSPSTVDETTKKLIPLKPVRVWDKGRSVGLEYIIHKAIKENPDERYQNMDEMLYDLENIDKLSPEYKKKMNFRFNTLITLVCTGVIGLSLSAFGWVSETVATQDKYTTYLESGKVGKNVDDLIEATKYSGSELAPYIELMKIYKEDSVLTEEESIQFLSALQPNLNALKSNNKYGDFSFEVGKMIWFNYYDNGQILSVPWFERAVEFNSSKKDLAKVYLEIGKFQQNILSSINDLTDNGMYKDYWESLKTLEDLGSRDEQVRLLLVQSTFDVVESYPLGLKSDGYQYDELSNVLERRIDLLSSTNPTNLKLSELKDTLMSRVDSVRAKLDTVYGKRG